MFAIEEMVVRLNRLLSGVDSPAVSEYEGEMFRKYLELLLKWNARTNLTAIRDAEGILERHFLESILCARILPDGIAAVLDFGSGGGFPGVPIAICRRDLAVTLAESQGKKVSFLREVVRALDLPVHVHGKRAEELAERFDCVTMRAVDRMEEAIRAAASLVKPGGWMVVMTSRQEAESVRSVAGEDFQWEEEYSLPGRELQVILKGRMFHVEH